MRYRNLANGFGQACVAAAFAAMMQAGAGITPAAALEAATPATHPFWAIDEVRAGVLDHGLEDSPVERGVGLNLEVLGGRFPGSYGNSVLDIFLTPRPHVGTTLGFGKTNEYYWGLTWDVKLLGPLYFETSFGGAIHDGPVDEPGLPSYGCRANFRESASLGYEVTEHLRVAATIDHISNANLCEPNHGLTNAGVRLGYRF
jgi:hypothetical protein